MYFILVSIKRKLVPVDHIKYISSKMCLQEIPMFKGSVGPNDS